MAKRQDEKPKRRSALEFEGTLRVNMLTPGPVLSVPYWTNKKKKPCEAQSKGRNRCWKDASRSSEHELEKYSQAACAKKKGVFEKAPKRTMDTGRVELDFLSEAQAKRLGVRPGPIMRFCHEVDQPGTLLPVLSPLEVQAKATDFNARIARFLPDIARRSAREIAGPDAPLGGLRRRGGLLSGLFSRR